MRNPSNKTPPPPPIRQASGISERAERWWPKLLGLWRSSLTRGRETDPGEPLSEAERHRLGRSLRELSLGLTRERSKSGTSYMENADFLGAYLLYFWPASYAQFLWLRALESGQEKSPRRLGRVLDLGAGPGPLSLAAFEEGAEEVTAVDASVKALEMARKIARMSGFPLRIKHWNSGEELPGGPFDSILSGHFINELLSQDTARAEALFADWAHRLAPGGRVYLVEPASLAVNRGLLTLRDRLAACGWTLVLPCVWKGECPALALEQATCHGTFSWEIPKPLRSLAWAARLGKEELKMTYFVWERPRQTSPSERTQQAAEAYRVVGDPLLSKSGRLRVMLCGPRGRFTISAASRKEAVPILALRRGDLVEVTAPEARESGWGIGPATRLKILARAPRK